LAYRDTSDFEKMKKQLKLSGERKDKFFTLIEKLQEDMQSPKEITNTVKNHTTYNCKLI
jgi:hypothetical protein